MLPLRALHHLQGTLVELSPSPRSNRGWAGDIPLGSAPRAQSTSARRCQRAQHTDPASSGTSWLEESRRRSSSGSCSLSALLSNGAVGCDATNSLRSADCEFLGAHATCLEPSGTPRRLITLLLLSAPPARHIGVTEHPLLSSPAPTCGWRRCQHASEDATWPTYSVARVTSSRRVRWGAGGRERDREAPPTCRLPASRRRRCIVLASLRLCAGILLGGGGLGEIFVLCTSDCCKKKPKHLLSGDGGAVFPATAFEQHGGCARHKKWRDSLKARGARGRRGMGGGASTGRTPSEFTTHTHLSTPILCR